MSDEEGKEKLTAPADFKGPTGNRGCTDILCMLLIVAHWIAATALGAFAAANGDYRVVLYPMDYNGFICGIKEYQTSSYAGGVDVNGVSFDPGTKADLDQPDLTDYPYLYPINIYGAGICVKKCPTISIEGQDYPSIDATTFVGEHGVTNVPTTESSLTADDIPPAATYPYVDGTYDLTTFDGKGFEFPVVDTTEFMLRCYLSTPAQDDFAAAYNGESVSAGEEEGVMTKFYADLWTSKGYVWGFGFGVSVIVAFVYSYMLRIPGVLFLMVWGCIGMVFGMFAGMGWYCYNEATVTWELEGDQHSQNEKDTMKYFGYIGFACAAIWALLMCFLRNRIALALGVVKEAAKSIAAMPVIIFFPIIQNVGLLVFMIVWSIYAVYLASMGDPVEAGYCSEGLQYLTEDACDVVSGTWIRYMSFAYDENQTNAAWYLLFTYFWTSQFIIAVGQIVVALCVAKWYFTRDKGTIGNATVFSSIKDAMYYHCGTAAFGSLIIAIIKMIRAYVNYLQKQAQKYGGKTAQAILCAIQCCLWCMEKCMKFLNKNAYIQTAIFGTNFCVSAKKAFFLILRNIARIGAVTLVSEFVIIIGKIFICVVTGGLTYFTLNENMGDEISSPIGPVLFVMVLSYFVGSMFMNIFSMAISTILQCFVADEEMFEGSERFAEGALVKFIADNGKPADDEKKDDTTL